MTVLDRLLSRLSRVYDRTAAPFLALRLQYDGQMAWSIVDGVLTTIVQGGIGVNLTIDLSQYTLVSLASYLAGQTGYSVPYIDTEMAGLSALVLVDGSNDIAISNGDHLLGASNPNWLYLAAVAGPLDAAQQAIIQLPKQLSLTTAEGEWLDLLGSYFAVQRALGETDPQYGPRVSAEVILPRVNNQAIVAALERTYRQFATCTNAIVFGRPEPSFDGASKFDGSKRFNAVARRVYNLFDVTVGYDMLGSTSPNDTTAIRQFIDRQRAAGTQLRYLTLQPSVVTDTVSLPTDTLIEHVYLDILSGTGQSSNSAIGILSTFSNTSLVAAAQSSNSAIGDLTTAIPLSGAAFSHNFGLAQFISPLSGAATSSNSAVGALSSAGNPFSDDFSDDFGSGGPPSADAGQTLFVGTANSANSAVGSLTTAPAVISRPTPPSPITAVTFGTGPDQLLLQMQGDALATGDNTSDAAGNPAFSVLIDGKQMGASWITTASHADGTYQNFAFNGYFGTGSHNVVVTFLNDAYIDGFRDRNLYVKAVIYNAADTAQSSTLLANLQASTFVVSGGTAAPQGGGGTSTSQAPGAVTVSAQVLSSSSIQYSWPDPANIGNVVGPITWRVAVKKTSDASFPAFATVGSDGYTATNLQASTSYDFSVTGVSADSKVGVATIRSSVVTAPAAVTSNLAGPEIFTLDPSRLRNFGTTDPGTQPGIKIDQNSKIQRIVLPNGVTFSGSAMWNNSTYVPASQGIDGYAYIRGATGDAGGYDELNLDDLTVVDAFMANPGQPWTVKIGLRTPSNQSNSTNELVKLYSLGGDHLNLFADRNTGSYTIGQSLVAFAMESGAPPVGVPSLMFLTNNGKKIRLYRNGSLVAETVSSTQFGGWGANGAQVFTLLNGIAADLLFIQWRGNCSSIAQLNAEAAAVAAQYPSLSPQQTISVGETSPTTSPAYVADTSNAFIKTPNWPQHAMFTNPTAVPGKGIQLSDDAVNVMYYRFDQFPSANCNTRALLDDQMFYNYLTGNQTTTFGNDGIDGQASGNGGAARARRFLKESIWNLHTFRTDGLGLEAMCGGPNRDDFSNGNVKAALLRPQLILRRGMILKVRHRAGTGDNAWHPIWGFTGQQISPGLTGGTDPYAPGLIQFGNHLTEPDFNDFFTRSGAGVSMGRQLCTGTVLESGPYGTLPYTVYRANKNGFRSHDPATDGGPPFVELTDFSLSDGFHDQVIWLPNDGSNLIYYLMDGSHYQTDYYEITNDTYTDPLTGQVKQVGLTLLLGGQAIPPFSPDRNNNKTIKDNDGDPDGWTLTLQEIAAWTATSIKNIADLKADINPPSPDTPTSRGVRLVPQP